MNLITSVYRSLVGLFIFCVLAGLASAQSNDELGFSAYYDQVYQIKVISPQAGSKSSFGSGFQVSADGLLVTNYHVVSAYVQAPENYQIEYQSHDGKTGSLQLLDFDVVSDLAVLRHSSPSKNFLNFASQELLKGETVYALGNPHDYGTTLVKGPNNGMVEHSYNDQVLFSGSLNSGMSGGPALNSNGEVVGVNVATAGSQLSFLVPSYKAQNLVGKDRHLSADDYQNEIARQIKIWQRPRVQALIDAEWPVERFVEHDLFGEIRKDFQCWGDTNDNNKKRHRAWASKSCDASDSIYLDYNLMAGQLYFSFEQTRSIDLSAAQFAATIRPGMSANNRSNYANSTNYQCHTDFIEAPEVQDNYTRVTTCIRAFKKLTGFFDSLLLIERVSDLQQLTTHLSISALERDQIETLNRKFMERSL